MRHPTMAAMLVMGLSACSVAPRLAPLPMPPASMAQGSGQETARLVRQLVLATFDRADRNHDRYLDPSEWDPADPAVADPDKDGRITSLEWAEAHPIEPLQARWQTAAADYFAHLDADHDGWLARSEAKGLATIPGLGMPSDLLFDRYSGLNPGGLSPRVMTDLVLQVAYDAGRFKPTVTPPVWPAVPSHRQP